MADDAAGVIEQPSEENPTVGHATQSDANSSEPTAPGTTAAQIDTGPATETLGEYVDANDVAITGPLNLPEVPVGAIHLYRSERLSLLTALILTPRNYTR